MTMCKFWIHGLHQHKPPCLWLWDIIQRFQITISNDLDAITMFYQCLIVVLALVDSCVVRRYKTSQISQRVTHKSSKSLQNVARVSLLYVEKFKETLNGFVSLGLFKNTAEKTRPAIFDWSSLILDRSSKAKPYFFFPHSIGLEPWNNHF